MGMATGNLLFQPTYDFFPRERPGFLSDDDLKRNVEKEVTELIPNFAGVFRVNRVDDFVRFFEEMGHERSRCLTAVPGVIRAQKGHERERTIENSWRFCGHSRVPFGNGRDLPGIEEIVAGASPLLGGFFVASFCDHVNRIAGPGLGGGGCGGTP
jgi:hypothetical protein